MRRCGTNAALTLLTTLALACSGGDTAGDSESQRQPGLPPDLGDMTPTIVLETNLGRIVAELDAGKAPKAVENIVYHVEAGFYDELTFHRVVPEFMIQGGGFRSDMGPRQSERPNVPNEADNGLKNTRGTLAMARKPDPNSASTQFFINLVDNAFLDHTAPTSEGWGYTVFGHVVEGMDVVDAIAAVQTGKVGQYENVPIEAVVIERAYLQEE